MAASGRAILTCLRLLWVGRATIGQAALRRHAAVNSRSRETGLGQANGSQDAGYARGMSKVMY
jgi:hypothetical protein